MYAHQFFDLLPKIEQVRLSGGSVLLPQKDRRSWQMSQIADRQKRPDSVSVFRRYPKTRLSHRGRFWLPKPVCFHYSPEEMRRCLEVNQRDPVQESSDVIYVSPCGSHEYVLELKYAEAFLFPLQWPRMQLCQSLVRPESPLLAGLR